MKRSNTVMSERNITINSNQKSESKTVGFSIPFQLPAANKLIIIVKWRHKMEYELEEVERDYIEFRKEIGEE